MLPDDPSAPATKTAKTSGFEVIKIKKGLAIYKQSRSPFWYVRCYMPFGGRHNQVISTKTDSEREARRIAEDFYVECAVKKRALGGDLPSGSNAAKDIRYSFATVAEEFLDDRKRYAGTNAKHLRNYHDLRKLVDAKNGLKAHFIKRDISAITTADIRDYLVYAEEQSSKGSLSASTRSKHLVTLNLILKYAYEKGLITTLPLMPKQRQVDNPRPWFDRREYRRLWVKALRISKDATKAGDLDKAKRFEEVWDFIVFMTNTFLRPSEWANLRHRHIKVHANGDTPHLEITVSDGKTIRYPRPAPAPQEKFEWEALGKTPRPLRLAPCVPLDFVKATPTSPVASTKIFDDKSAFAVAPTYSPCALAVRTCA